MTISFPQNVSFNAVSSRVAGTEFAIEPTAIAPFKVINTAGTTFSQVAVGDVVCIYDYPGTFATVTVVDSATELTLDKDIIKGTSDYYLVLTADSAFKVIQDGTDHNFLQLFSPGSRVDTEATEDLNYTVSGCGVVSVDSPTQLTTDIPMGGYDFIHVTTDKKAFCNVENIDVFYISNDEIVLTGYKFEDFEYPAILTDLEPQGSLDDVVDAISKSVAGGYRNDSPINTRTFGATVRFTF
jgi:hypothetical protein